MTDTPEKSTELSLRDHAFQEIDAVAEGIAALKAKWSGVVFDVTTTKGMDDARRARAEIRQPRYDVEKIRKSKGSELSKIAKDINARAADITDEILAIEVPIDAQIKKEEDRKEIERVERERLQKEARAKQEARISAIRSIPLDLVTADVEAIDAAIQVLLSDTLEGIDEVYFPDAKAARDDSLERLAILRTQRAEAIARDQEVKALREQQARLEQEREAERQAEAAARQQREQEERERVQREAAYDSAVDDIRAYASKPGTAAELSALLVELEGIEITAERYGNRAPVAEQAQRTGIMVLQDRIATARELEAARATAEAQQRQLDEQAAEQRRQAQEAEARERERQQQAELDEAQRIVEAQREAIRNASAHEAMTEALALLEREGYGKTVEAEKLRAVLGRAPT